MRNFSFATTLVVLALFIGMTSCSEDPVLPNARYSFAVDGLTVTFTDASQDADTYSWDFGDGNSSTDASPVHTYAADGTYTVILTTSNSDGSSTDSQDVAVMQLFNADFLAGNWKVPSEEASLAVGPELGSAEWWFLPAGDLEVRACGLDDIYTFGADGSFSYDQQGETFLEGWQGADACGAPVAPHDGSGSFTFETTATSLTLKGQGAYLGLAKVGNMGELPNVDAPSEITYDVVEMSGTGDNKRIKLNVEAGTGVFWTMFLVSE